MATHEETKAAGGNDVGDWGEKDLSGAYPKGTTFDINGEKLDVDSLPDFFGGDMGELESTGDTGNFGDIYEEETRTRVRAPLRSS